jgi:hypothetical protein
MRGRREGSFEEEEDEKVILPEWGIAFCFGKNEKRSTRSTRSTDTLTVHLLENPMRNRNSEPLFMERSMKERMDEARMRKNQRSLVLPLFPVLFMKCLIHASTGSVHHRTPCSAGL